MPSYLALETSTEHLSLALHTPEGLFLHAEHVGQKHAELTLPALEQLLVQAGVTRAELAGVAFAMGPGSFTGLRIGCGIAQGLAFGLDIPVVGVSTLEALAQQCPGDLAYICIDARMNQVYTAAYQREGEQWHEIFAADVLNPDTIPVPEQSGWMGLGSGFAAYADTLQQRLGAQLADTMPDAYPHARNILALALPRFEAGQGMPADQPPCSICATKWRLKPTSGWPNDSKAARLAGLGYPRGIGAG